MQFDKLTLYPCYDLHTPAITERSVLYFLEPINMGTLECESLISYLIRLAEAHCVTPDKLIKHKIYPFFWGHDDLSTSDKGIIGRTFTNRSYIKLLNFSGWYTSKLVESLEHLTLRRDLTCLTMMHWHELITCVYLLRDCKAWCPSCYSYWHQNKLPIYEPLLWSFEPVAVCSHHHYPLITQCPYCNHRLPIIAPNSRLGYCSHCGEWLGNLEKYYKKSHDLYHSELALQSELIKILGLLIALNTQASQNESIRFYRQIITYFQLKELENIELSNSQISQKRIHKSMSSIKHTIEDFWKLSSRVALENCSKN
ncbi:TniQ family protein [Scytonema sp. NUACC26]|uniref:TniQ family protein n=1 Tax=Scytonema sp. NUACC26 TaxID=3140176 RepID=UPI0034DBD2D7